jgi:hypothetical protein
MSEHETMRRAELAPDIIGLTVESLQAEYEKTRDRLTSIEQHRRTIAVSDQTDRIVDLERDLATASEARPEPLSVSSMILPRYCFEWLLPFDVVSNIFASAAWPSP